MAKKTVQRKQTGKRHAGRVTNNTRSKKDKELLALAAKKTRSESMRKLDLKKRGEKVREWQAHMKAARVGCVKRNIGASKHLNPANCATSTVLHVLPSPAFW
jgi:hypothetical protein